MEDLDEAASIVNSSAENDSIRVLLLVKYVAFGAALRSLS